MHTPFKLLIVAEHKYRTQHKGLHPMHPMFNLALKIMIHELVIDTKSIFFFLNKASMHEFEKYLVEMMV